MSGSDTLVWSSDRGYVGDRGKPQKQKSGGRKGKRRGGTPDAGFPKDGVIRVRRETGGRGGKTVTVLYGVPGTPDECQRLFKELKKLCGGGGTFKDGRIEIQGDHRNRILALLEQRGLKAKAAGG